MSSMLPSTSQAQNAAGKFSVQSEDKSLRKITCVVVALHAVLIMAAIFIGPSEMPKQMPPPRRFVVQTVALSPKISASAPISSPPIIAEAMPILEPEPSAIEPLEEVVEEPIVAAEPPPPEPLPLSLPEPTTPSEEKLPEPEKEIPKKKPSVEKSPAKPKPKAVEKPKTPPKKVEPKKPTPPPKKPTPPKPPVKKAVPQPDTKAKEKAAAEKKRQQEETEKRKKKEAQEQAERARKQKLVSQAQERIAKIGTSRDKATAGKGTETALKSVPSAITSLHVDALPVMQGGPPLSDREISYRDELAGRLKLMLRLPEYGDVKIKLTLDRSGKVASVVIVSSESAANRKYIEKTLPGMTFPAFGANFGSAAQYAFSITLSNDL